MVQTSCPVTQWTRDLVQGIKGCLMLSEGKHLCLQTPNLPDWEEKPSSEGRQGGVRDKLCL